MKSIIVKPGIVSLEIHGCFLLAADKDARKTCPFIREISETGAFVWNLFSKGKDIEEILDIIHEEYDVPESVDLKTDILNFYNTLREQNYIIVEKEAE